MKLRTTLAALSLAFLVAGGFTSAARAECAVQCADPSKNPQACQTHRLSGSVRDTWDRCVALARQASRATKASFTYVYPSQGVSGRGSCDKGACRTSGGPN